MMDEDVSFHELMPLSPCKIGAATIQTIVGRRLREALKVGRDYPTWFKAICEKYGFVEDVDYVVEKVSPQSGENPSAGGRPAIEHHLSIGMAKEIGMVDHTAIGRQIRRHFLECERIAIEALQNGGVSAEVLRRQDGMIRMMVGKVTRLEASLKALKADNTSMSGQIGALAAASDPKQAASNYRAPLDLAIQLGAPPRGRNALVRVIGNRLANISANWGIPVRLSLETRKRLFSPDVCQWWLDHEGKDLLARRAARSAGQGNLRLVVPEPAPPAGKAKP